MHPSLAIYATLVFVTTTFVLWDTRRRRRIEHDAATGDDWEFTTAGPLRWSALTFAAPFIGLPAYLLRSGGTKSASAAIVSAALCIAACMASYKLLPDDALKAPWQPKRIAWTRLPPGLPPSVREATEKLPTTLAIQVVDILPSLVAVGQSYPGGAEISVMPEDKGARVLLDVHDDAMIAMAGLTIYAGASEAERGLAVEMKKKRSTARTSLAARDLRVVKIGPAPAKGARNDAHYIEAKFRMGVVVAEILLQERAVDDNDFSATRRATLEAASDRLVEKVAAALASVSR